MTTPAPATLEREKEKLPYPPPWQDAVTLALHICTCCSTIDNWVAAGILPPPKKRGGKLMWEWAEVDTWMRDGPKNKPFDATGIYNAGKAIRAGKESAGNGRH